MVSATNAAGNTAYTAYGSAGRVITETDYEQNVTSYEYDSLGRVIKAEKAIDSETGLNNIVITAYDELGNTESIWTSNNEPGQAITYDRVSYEYNWRNSPVKETLYNNNGDDPESYTQYYYDEAGNLVRMYTGMSEPLTITGLDSVSGGGDGYSTIKYEYDYLNRLVKTVDALGQEEIYTPNYNGTNDIKVDRNGNKIQSDYDYFGNLINISSETTDGKKYSHSYEYNKLGAVTKADNVTFEYDNLGNMVKETDNDNHTVKECAYDSFGNRTEFKLTVNGAEEQHLKYEYNDVNLLDKILDLRDNSIIEEYEYTPNGIISQKYTPATNVTVYYKSNNAGQIKKITVKKGEETIGEYEYSYYANGNQKDKREVINSSEAKETEYEYDGLGRLVTETSGNTTTKYNYDTRGNRTSMEVTGGDLPYTKNYEYDRNNRLKTENKVLSSGTETIRYSYDPNGNMVSMASSGVTQSKESPEISIGGIQSSGTGIYEYDGFNRLVKVHTGGTEAEYTYNADGLRQSKTLNGVTTKQIWDGSNIVGETDGSGAVLSVYTRGLKGVISDRAGEEETYYIYDGHGDVNMLMNSTGEIIKQYSYDAFGVEQNKDDSDTNPFRYCGEYFDNETESIYLRARYYNPDSGRFITEDPIRDGLNWYGYCDGNPIMFVDPIGTHDVPLYDGDTIYDVRYDIRELIKLFGGVLKVEDNIVKIKALGKVSTIDLAALSSEEEGMRAEDRHLIQDSLHYTIKEFLNLIGADYKITTTQIEVTDTDVRVQKFEQFAGASAVKLLQVSFESVVAAMGVVGQAITSISDFLGFSWGGNYDEILTSGFYKKQFIEIFDEHGKGIITNYITQQHTNSNTLAYYYKEFWNADMNEMAFYGWEYP